MNIRKRLLFLTTLAALLVTIPSVLADFGGFEGGTTQIIMGVIVFFIVFAIIPIFAELKLKKNEKRLKGGGIAKTGAYKTLSKIRTSATYISGISLAAFIGLSVAGFDISEFALYFIAAPIIAIVLGLFTWKMGKKKESTASADQQAKMEAADEGSGGEKRELRKLEDVKTDIEDFKTEMKEAVEKNEASKTTLKLTKEAIKVEKKSTIAFTAIQAVENAEKEIGDDDVINHRSKSEKKHFWTKILDMHENLISKIDLEMEEEKAEEKAEESKGKKEDKRTEEELERDRDHLEKLKGFVKEMRKHWKKEKKKHWKDWEKGILKEAKEKGKEAHEIEKMYEKKEGEIIKRIEEASEIEDSAQRDLKLAKIAADNQEIKAEYLLPPPPEDEEED